MLLRNWSRKLNGIFSEPGGPLKDQFEGVVFGHPAVPDGQKTALTMQRFDPQEEAFRDAENRVVRLKEPDPLYEDLYPKPDEKIRHSIKNRLYVA